MILSLQTSTFSAFGGIQTYNRLVCRVLNEIGPGQNRILIARDTQADVQQPGAEFKTLKLEAFHGKRFALLCKIVHLAVTQKINLVLIGHVNYAPLGWLIKLLQPRVRYAVMLYGVEAWRHLPPLKKYALQRADFLISISEYTRNEAIKANALRASRIHLLPNALEWNHAVSETEQAMLRSKGTRLLSVCRLDDTERYKGVDKVIEALPEIAKTIPEIHYSVVGAGTDLARHKDLAERMGVARRVDFLGFLADEALREQYRECDVFVMPSAAEGFGFVFLEAMKYAKPIVAASSAGAPEVVQDGITGLLIEYGNREGLARAVTDLCLDSALRVRLGEAGRQRLQDKYRYANFKTKLTEILAQEMTHSAYSQTDESASCAS